MPAPRRRSPFVAAGVALVGEIFGFARKELRGLSLRAFAQEINDFWGSDVVNHTSLHKLEEGKSDVLPLHTMSFGQPFTYWPSRGRPFTLHELLAVARGELEPCLSIGLTSPLDAIGRWIARDCPTDGEQISLVRDRGISVARWAQLKKGRRPNREECAALCDLLDLSEDHLLMLAGHAPRLGRHFPEPDDIPPPISLPKDWEPVLPSDAL